MSDDVTGPKGGGCFVVVRGEVDSWTFKGAMQVGGGGGGVTQIKMISIGKTIHWCV